MTYPTSTEELHPWVETAPAVFTWNGYLQDFLDEYDTEVFLHRKLSQPLKDKELQNDDMMIISILRPQLPEGQHLQDLVDQELDDNDITEDTTLPERPSPSTSDRPRPILFMVKEILRQTYNLAPVLNPNISSKRMFILFRAGLSLKLTENKLYMDDLARIRILCPPQWAAVTRTAELEQNIRILKAEVEELKRKVEDLERDAKPQRRPGDSLRSRGWFKEILSEQFGIREDSGAGAS